MIDDLEEAGLEGASSEGHGVSQRAPRLSRVEIVANERSGSVGPGAAAQAEEICRRFGVTANVRVLGEDDLMYQLKAAVAAKPDALIVLAGDGTANAAATLCGPDGPLVAPLPGGTMNMLPYAIYGRQAWTSALESILTDGRVQPVAGGEVNGRAFHVAAILGDPTLWAPAREALRHGKLKLAIDKALYAWRRNFRRRLRYSLDGSPHRKAQALALMCPLVSRGVPDDNPALEAVGIDPPGWGAVLRLGLNALMTPLIGPALGGDWRSDPSVTPGQCREGRAYARRHINAILDGEPVRLPKFVEIHFKPVAFRALAPAQPPKGSAKDTV